MPGKFLKKFNLFIFELGIFNFLLLFMFIHVEAQPPSDHEQADMPSQDVVTNFQPSLAVVIAVLAIMFSITFILLLYAKFCHRAAVAVHLNQENQDLLTQSRSRFSGIDKTVIESLPFFKFSSLRGSREGLECSVCLSKFEDIEILRLLPKCKHAFHIDCVDQWLDKHSSCPLCRHKVSVDDITFFTYSHSLRFLWNNNSELRDDSNLELVVQREEDQDQDQRGGGSSRFSIGSSFRKSGGRIKKEEEVPIQEMSDFSDENEKANNLHKFNHKINIVSSDVVLKNRWSSVSSSDLMFLNSEMIKYSTSLSNNRFINSVDSNNEKLPLSRRILVEEDVLKIKEEMERKREFESKLLVVNRINQGDHSSPFSGHPNTTSVSQENPTSRILNPKEKRSMSDITLHPRFRDQLLLGKKSSTTTIRESSSSSSPSHQNTVKEERLRQLWLPIARRTVQWFANREEERTQHSSPNTRQSLNV